MGCLTRKRIAVPNEETPNKKSKSKQETSERWWNLLRLKPKRRTKQPKNSTLLFLVSTEIEVWRNELWQATPVHAPLLLNGVVISVEAHVEVIKSHRCHQKLQEETKCLELLTIEFFPRHDEPSPKRPRFSEIDVNRYSAVEGIHGANNSCYMDSSLVSLFLFNKQFLDCIHSSPLSDPKKETTRKILLKFIAKSLNKHKKLGHAHIKKLRNALADATKNEGYRSSQMDPEEFIRNLFGDVLAVDKFYYIEERGAFVFQTMFPPGVKNISDVQGLLEGSFKFQDMKLDNIPKPGFLIKMPATKGERAYSTMHPNLKISLDNILEDADLTQTSELYLSAVICLVGNHCMAFVRMDEEDHFAPWIFLDSFGFRSTHVIPKLSYFLETKETAELGNEDMHLIDFLLRNVYICVYT